MRRSMAGRRACALSPYHMALHVEAQRRATEMLAMLRTGKTYAEVGKEFGKSEAAVKSALKRQGLKR